MPHPKLGQHFLIKGSILERIAQAACPTAADLVIEIGPGRGALTERLLQRAARVVAIEVDPVLADHLERKLGGEGRLEVVRGDVLGTDLGPWRGAPIAGNLPYYITSPILHRFFESPALIDEIHIVIQAEVALRLVARPGTRDYGYLSVLTQFFSRPVIALKLPPEAFRPPPEVESALVSMSLPGDGAKLGIADSEKFLKFVKACFAQKRKTLVNNVRGMATPEKAKEALAAMNLSAAARAEELSVAELGELYARLS